MALLLESWRYGIVFESARSLAEVFDNTLRGHEESQRRSSPRVDRMSFARFEFLSRIHIFLFKLLKTSIKSSRVSSVAKGTWEGRKIKWILVHIIGKKNVFLFHHYIKRRVCFPLELGLVEKTPPTHRDYQIEISRRIAMEEFSNSDGVHNMS